jgi:predicted amidohydrolase
MTEQSLYRSQLTATGDNQATWRTSAPRAEVAAQFCMGDDGSGWQDETGSLQTQLPDVIGAQGKWIADLDSITGGVRYRLTVRFQATGITDPRQSVYARVVWQGIDGALLSHDRQEYFAAVDENHAGEWSTITGVRLAPPDARQAELQLVVASAPGATVRWSGIEWSLPEADAKREITVASVYLRPRSPSTPASNIEQFCGMIDAAGQAGADLCVLPEAITVVGVPGAKPADVAEAIPGPISEKLGHHAQQSGMYVVACYPERHGPDVYNTAILLDRNGRLVGKYRKTHLPNEEVDAGYTAGDSYPVFRCDFGMVGLMICWDVAFPEPARALAIAGAEILLMPIWGGNETLMSARAIENAVYVVSSSYGSPTGVIDPLGAWQAVVRPEDEGIDAGEGHLVLATIDLADRKRWDWVGDFSQRWQIERRGDIPMEIPAQASIGR